MKVPGAFLWPTPPAWTISRRAEDVQSLHAVHLSALTLNAPFNSFLPAHDPVLSRAGAFDGASIVMTTEAWQKVLSVIGGQYKER